MATDQAVETVANNIEDVAELTRRLNGQKLGYFFAGTGIGVAAGFAVGYFALSSRLKTKYEKLADERIKAEVAEMREHYRQMRIGLEDAAQKRRPLEELIVEKGYAQAGEKAGERYDEAERRAIDEVNASVADDEGSVQGDEQGTSERSAPSGKGFGPSFKDLGSNTGSPLSPQEPTGSVKNVFKEGNADTGDAIGWDYETEVKRRSRDVPYIIHVDEFRENAQMYEQMTVTYYEEDDVLATDTNHVIEDMDEAIGLGNLGRWGYGSNDPNIVYIRNEEMSVDFEVQRDHGSFHETVHSIRHSAMRRRPYE